MITIKHPNAAFSGVVAGLHFAGGTATAGSLTGSQREELERLDYRIVEHDSLEDLTVAELRDLADNRGVDLDGASRKAEIIDAIQAAE